MTGLGGNRQIYLPREIQAILNLKGQIDLPITRGTSHYLFYYTIILLKEKNDYFNWKLISFTMGLVTKNTYV